MDKTETHSGTVKRRDNGGQRRGEDQKARIGMPKQRQQKLHPGMAAERWKRKE